MTKVHLHNTEFFFIFSSVCREWVSSVMSLMGCYSIFLFGFYCQLCCDIQQKRAKINEFFLFKCSGVCWKICKLLYMSSVSYASHIVLNLCATCLFLPLWCKLIWYVEVLLVFRGLKARGGEFGEFGSFSWGWKIWIFRWFLDEL